MATLTTIPTITRHATTRLQRNRMHAIVTRAASSQVLFLCGTTLLAFLLLGYHPYAEDGGIYAAAAALRLNPSLFPAEHAFAVGQTNRSFFVPAVAITARVLHLQLAGTLLLLHIGAIAATIASAMVLARSLFLHAATQRWAVLTVAVSLGVPVAGTSLYLCDPYLTARSLSTPLLLLGTAALLRRRTGTVAVCLAFAFALHPMMGAWAAVLYLFLLAQQSDRPSTYTLAAGIGVLAVMGTVALVAPHETAAARAAALTRDYWFLSRWHWYESIGLLAPPLLLFSIAQRRDLRRMQPAYRHAAVAIAAAVVAIACGSFLFVHGTSQSLLLARMQPLRILHPAYLLMVMLLGGFLAESRVRWLKSAAVATAAAALIGMQLQTYPGSHYFEVPGMPAANAWVRAFEWAGHHTPVDAVFALDARYTSRHGEDAQLFRAIALRSQLPDAAKDGGISSVMTGLAAEWAVTSAAQTGLDTATDVQRIVRVRPLGATWIVLPASAPTLFDCPYTNDEAKVCKLGQMPVRHAQQAGLHASMPYNVSPSTR